MDFKKSLSVPFYEYLCTIIPCKKLQRTKSKLKPNKRNFKGYHEFVFYMIDECNSSISRAESFEEMDKRVIINFYKANESNETLVNEIPPHLKIRVNQYQIPLSEYLPYDICRSTGRRFPRSIDITDPVFLSKTSENQCIINWDQDQDDLNNGKYYFGLNLVRMRSCEELCVELMNNSIYPFENTQKGTKLALPESCYEEEYHCAKIHDYQKISYFMKYTNKIKQYLKPVKSAVAESNTNVNHRKFELPSNFRK